MDFTGIVRWQTTAGGQSRFHETVEHATCDGLTENLQIIPVSSVDYVAIYHDFNLSKRHSACPCVMAGSYWHCSPGYRNVLDWCCITLHCRHVVCTATRALVDADIL
jgi:hypothetical protein